LDKVTDVVRKFEKAYMTANPWDANLKSSFCPEIDSATVLNFFSRATCFRIEARDAQDVVSHLPPYGYLFCTIYVSECTFRDKHLSTEGILRAWYHGASPLRFFQRDDADAANSAYELLFLYVVATCFPNFGKNTVNFREDWHRPLAVSDQDLA
jgi:hypothetical protein